MTMDARKQRVLQAIVALYGLEGEPVGSSVLANYFDMAVSSATLRNEMAALTKLGLLEQPHTSAGRVPSAKGYRYYLDNLLTDDQPLDRVTRARVDAVFASLDHEPEKLAQGAARALADIVERDERESGDRRKLNLGHTLAHAIEKASNRMNHGEAVAVGTALIAGAAVKLGALTQADCDRIGNVLTALGFDLTPPVEVKRLLKEVGKDKKNEDGMLRIVLPVGIGDCEVRPMTMDAFAALF